MNIKDQSNFIALQEQVIALLIKVNVMETFLIEKNLITADEYNKRMEAAAASVASALKEVFEKAANQVKERQDKIETKDEAVKDEGVGVSVDERIKQMVEDEDAYILEKMKNEDKKDPIGN